MDAPDSDVMEEILRTARKFYDNEVIPKREEMDGDPALCRSLLKRMGTLGLLIPSLPTEYGGLDLSRYDRTRLSAVGSAGNPSLSLSVGAHGLLCSGTILYFGSKEQKDRYLPKLVAGELIGCWGVTEPDAGSDVGSMRASAVLKGDHYVLNGNKTFITNAPICDVAVVFAKVGDSPKGITGFILEKGMKGLSFGKPMKKYGMEGSPTGDIYLENVTVPRSQRIGEEGEGFAQIKKIFNNERLFLGGSTIGIMRHCLQTAIKYASTRKTFGQPILNYQAVQLKIAEIYSRIAMVELALKTLCDIPEDAPEFHMKASALKIFASRWAVETCSDTMQLLGGLGYTREMDIERFLRDSKLYEIGGGTTDIQLLIIFKGLLKAS
jgi:alkylation response protein AidB-like acyl-CoA dehydrogenase